MADEAKFHVGIKAMILNDRNEVLLLKSGPEETKHTKVEYWDFPGGRIKEGHGIEETLRREIMEELGVPGEKLEISGIFDATISNFKMSHGENVSLMLLVYRCMLPKDSKFKLSDEHSEWKWMKIGPAKLALDIKYPRSFLEKLDALG
jgi:8-oxo-dGTP pyrophosphatase MutT (NUDIX family)